MTPEQVWRQKTDDELLAASQQLQDYTEEGQAIIRAELERRRELERFAPAPVDDQPTDEPVPSGLLLRLWRGHVPLVDAYFKWGIGGTIAMAMLFGLSFAGGPIAVVLFSPIFLGYLVLINVCIWRSAGRYRGNRLWAELARISIAAGIARGVVLFLFDV